MESHVEPGYIEDFSIDREKICPFLLRVFCSNMRHNQVSEYARGSVPANELQIYTWMDCSLRELMGLIKEVNAEARRPGTEFQFAIVRPGETEHAWRSYGGYEMRDIGTTISGQRGVDDNKTLAQCKLTIGDFMDVAVIPAAMVGGPRGPPMMGRGPPPGMMMGRRY